jgi:hypothetical protein
MSVFIGFCGYVALGQLLHIGGVLRLVQDLFLTMFGCFDLSRRSKKDVPGAFL